MRNDFILFVCSLAVAFETFTVFVYYLHFAIASDGEIVLSSAWRIESFHAIQNSTEDELILPHSD